MKSTPHAIKATAPYTLAGRGVVFGGEDLTGDRFSKDTDFGATRSFVGMPVYYDHALGGIKSAIGTVKAWTPTDEGIDVEIELDRRHKYVADVMKLAEKGALGLSTGAASHLVERIGGDIKRWIVAEISLTPTPAEPRTTTEVKTTGNPVRTAADVTGHDDTNRSTSTEDTMSDIKEAVKAAINELAGEPVAGGTFQPTGTVKALPAVPASNPFASNEYVQAYKSYIRGSEDSSVLDVIQNAKRAAYKNLNEGTANDGGATVPTEVNREIIAKRDYESLLGKFNFRRATTETWKHLIPAQGNKASAAIVGEGVTANASNPNFSNSRTVQMYKDSLEFELTDELLADTTSNLEQFLQEEIARAMAVSANNYIINGTGSGQPYGLLTRVTNTSAFSATAITNAQLLALLGDISAPYANGGGLIMSNSTWFALRTLDLTNYNRMTSIENGIRYVEGYRAEPSADIADIGTTNKSVIWGNFGYYAFVERTSGVQIERWRDVRKGLTYIVATWRYGGDVVQPEAFSIGVHA